MGHGHDHGHDHGHGHEQVDWAALADHLEREGELLLGFVTETAARVAALRTAPVARVLDLGSGPGVGTCELALRFPTARVVAVDATPAMLERVSTRAAAHGVGDRVTTLLAELPDGVADLEPADLVWASNALHHVGDEVAALVAFRSLLVDDGLLALAERTDTDSEWFQDMRAAIPGSVPSADLTSMLAAAGYEVLSDRVEQIGDTTRRLVIARPRA